jgi:hypothetical protein
MPRSSAGSPSGGPKRENFPCLTRSMVALLRFNRSKATMLRPGQGQHPGTGVVGTIDGICAQRRD